MSGRVFRLFAWACVSASRLHCNPLGKRGVTSFAVRLSSFDDIVMVVCRAGEEVERQVSTLNEELTSLKLTVAELEKERSRFSV